MESNQEHAIPVIKLVAPGPEVTIVHDRFGPTLE